MQQRFQRASSQIRQPLAAQADAIARNDCMLEDLVTQGARLAGPHGARVEHLVLARVEELTLLRKQADGDVHGARIPHRLAPSLQSLLPVGGRHQPVTYFTTAMPLVAAGRHLLQSGGWDSNPRGVAHLSGGANRPGAPPDPRTRFPPCFAGGEAVSKMNR